jgi:hypothetical protein
MNLLSAKAHGVIDYLLVVAFLLAPSLLGFDGVPATTARVLAVVHLLLTVTTRFPLGLVSLVPFPLHGILEFFVGVLLLAMPWILGFNDVATAKSFYVGVGAGVLLVFLVTDYTSR